MWEQENAAFWHWETKASKSKASLLVLIMLFSSLVAISQAVYNFPHESYNYQNSVNGPAWCGNADVVVKVKMNKYMKLFLHLHKNRYLLTFTGYKRQ